MTMSMAEWARLSADCEHEWGESMDGALFPASRDRRRCRRCGCIDIPLEPQAFDALRAALADDASESEVDAFFEAMTPFIGDGQ
jgi:hypothetical protein